MRTITGCAITRQVTSGISVLYMCRSQRQPRNTRFPRNPAGRPEAQAEGGRGEEPVPRQVPDVAALLSLIRITRQLQSLRLAQLFARRSLILTLAGVQDKVDNQTYQQKPLLVIFLLIPGTVLCEGNVTTCCYRNRSVFRYSRSLLSHCHYIHNLLT